MFVPYCTGDLHGGSNVATYDVLGPRPFHHVGHLNLQAALPLVRATWPGATRVTVSGSSAGGFGATLNYDTIRRAYPAATIALVDDAGPFLEGSGIPPDQHANWNTNWHLDALVGPLCPSCQNDLSQMYPALAALYPSDRMALLSSLQDQVIRTYFLILLGADYRGQAARADRRPAGSDPHLSHVPHPGREPHAARDHRHDGGGRSDAGSVAGTDGDRRAGLDVGRPRTDAAGARAQRI